MTSELAPGDLFTVTGEHGRFKYMGTHPGDGSLTAYGPLDNKGSQNAQWRAFKPERVKKVIHRKEVK